MASRSVSHKKERREALVFRDRRQDRIRAGRHKRPGVVFIHREWDRDASYGEEHARALHGVWGDPDSEDLLRTIDWAVRTGLADRDRVGLCGLSYGGYMVHWLLANFPGKFKAAVSENPLSDMVADLGASDSAAYLDEGIGLGSFPDKADSWHARSSIYRIHRNHAPLLLLQADDDLRCPPVHSEIPYSILKMRGRATRNATRGVLQTMAEAKDLPASRSTAQRHACEPGG